MKITSAKKQSGDRVLIDGFSLVEVLLAVSLFALFSYGFSTTYFTGQESSALAGERARAVLYAQEGVEAVRSIRNNEFANLQDGTYGLQISNDQWELIPEPDTNNKFIREIEITSEGSNKRQIASIVNWQQSAQRDGSVRLLTHLTNWQALAAAESPLTVVGSVASEWDSGFCYTFTVNNTSDQQIPTWQIEFDAPGFSIYSGWNGNYNRNSSQYTVTPENFNRQISPGGSVNDIGFCADKTGGSFLPENAQASVPEQSTESLAYDLNLTSEWGGGYCAELTVRNEGQESVSTWETYLDLNDSTFTSTWDADYTPVSGDVYRVTPKPYNSSLSSGQEETAGFCASKNGGNSTPTITDQP